MYVATENPHRQIPFGRFSIYATDRFGHRHVAHSRSHHRGSPHYRRSGGNPGAFMGHVIGGMVGGMFR